ncbi:MAG: hypothetical protein ACTSQJ_19100, partial [Promethearchaeota archaeon]
RKSITKECRKIKKKKFQEKIRKKEKIKQEKYKKKKVKDTRKPKIKKRKGVSFRYSHLYKFKCIIPPNNQSGLSKDFVEKTHHVYYTSRSEIPHNSLALKQHKKYYPNHIFQSLRYIHTKKPSH